MIRIFTVYDGVSHNSVRSFYEQSEAVQFLSEQNDSHKKGLRIIESELTTNEITLEKYLKANYHQSIEYWVRVDTRNGTHIIIKPMHISGDTLEFKVTGNTLEFVS